MAENHGAEWRELCAAAEKEQDPAKLASLVNQIVTALNRAEVIGPDDPTCQGSDTSQTAA